MKDPYRYELTRDLDGTEGPLIFIMLNPSTADETLDDPTIRRCIGFAKRENASVLQVVNLFALRATKPVDLFAATRLTAVGVFNDHVLRANADASIRMRGRMVAAWGSQPKAVWRVNDVKKILGSSQLFCLGQTKDGSPRHPLYVKSDAPLVRWRFP